MQEAIGRECMGIFPTMTYILTHKYLSLRFCSMELDNQITKC